MKPGDIRYTLCRVHPAGSATLNDRAAVERQLTGDLDRRLAEDGWRIADDALPAFEIKPPDDTIGRRVSQALVTVRVVAVDA